MQEEILMYLQQLHASLDVKQPGLHSLHIYRLRVIRLHAPADVYPTGTRMISETDIDLESISTVKSRSRYRDIENYN